MKKILAGILCLWSAVCMKIHGAQLSAALDTNSTPGNFFGSLHLSFSATNGNDFHYDATYNPPELQWNTTQISTNFTVLGSAAQIGLYLTVGGEGPTGEYNLYTGFSFSDSSTESFFFNPFYPLSAGSFNVGQPTVDEMTFSSGNVILYNSGPPWYPVGTLDFSYALPVNFDGTSGNADGSWSLTYNFTITPTPEPSADWLMALGGFGFWLARAMHRRRN